MKEKREKRTFTLLGKDVPKLLQLYFQVTMSEAFLKCADEQWTRLFEQQTSITIKDRTIWIGWESDDPFHYEKGDTSKLKATLWLKYGHLTIFLCWRSVSGRIYELSDPVIDCNDLQCWLEGLDVERAKFLNKPVWTLFPFPEIAIDMFKRENPAIDISLSFVRAADVSLTPWFEKMAGFKVNKEVCINLHTGRPLSYVRDTTSRLAVTFYINHNWNQGAFICWRSRSGKVYNIADTAIDPGDIEFWLEGIDPVLYNRQMYPGDSLPFKLKSLSYELVVERLNQEMVLTVYLKPDKEQEVESITSAIDQFIQDYNGDPGKKDRQNGVVHNWRKDVEKGKIIYEIDTGFAGAPFLKKFLELLSGQEAYTRVEVG